MKKRIILLATLAAMLITAGKAPARQIETPAMGWS